MKRTISFLTLILIMAMLLNVMSVGAADQATFEVQTASAKAGESVDVTISVKNSPGITSTKLTVAFGDDLTLTNVTYGTDITGNFVKPKNMTSPVILNWANGLEDFAGDYVFATLSFLVAEDAEAGLCPITVTYDPDDVYNVEETNASFAIQNGGVQIEVPPVSVTGVSLNKSTLSLMSGKTETLIATVIPEKATNKTVTWKSIDTSIATVDSNGKVTAVKEGSTTITVTTKDGSFSASCKVNVECSHTEKTETPYKSPDCITSGNNKYYTCNACGDVFKADGVTETTVKDESISTLPHEFTEKIEDVAHLVPGSGADCQHAKHYYYDCSRCDVMGTNTFDGTTTGEHKMETTWTTENGKHYHKCSITGCTYIADEASCSGGTATCIEKAVCDVCGGSYGTVGTHDWESTWSSDVSGHWNSCKTSGCTEKIGFAVHDPDHQGGATEEYAIKCTICQYVIEQQLAHTHVYDQEVATDAYKATDANCMAKATYFRSCKCGEKGTEIFECGDYADHKWNVATCTNPKTCSVCQATEGIALGHTEGTEWRSDKDNHWHICTVVGCGAIVESSRATHIPDRTVATETDSVKCSVCEYVIEPALTHTHAHGADWKSDKDNHWNECVCGDMANTAAHEDADNDGKCNVCTYNVGVLETDSPETGDNSIMTLWITLLCISGLGIIAVTVYSKKKSF